jgi:hypothetical protein
VQRVWVNRVAQEATAFDWDTGLLYLNVPDSDSTTVIDASNFIGRNRSVFKIGTGDAFDDDTIRIDGKRPVLKLTDDSCIRMVAWLCFT